MTKKETEEKLSRTQEAFNKFQNEVEKRLTKKQYQTIAWSIGAFILGAILL